MARKYIWPKGIKITGFGQFRNILFKSKNRNTDLFENFFMVHARQDQYWISISVPGDEDGYWEEHEIEKLENEIVSDFEYEGFRVGIELEHGTGFPRSMPLTWFFGLTDAEDVHSATNDEGS